MAPMQVMQGLVAAILAKTSAGRIVWTETPAPYLLAAFLKDGFRLELRREEQFMEKRPARFEMSLYHAGSRPVGTLKEDANASGTLPKLWDAAWRVASDSDAKVRRAIELIDAL